MKRTERIDAIGKVDANPEKDVGFYIESKQHVKLLSKCKPPNWDSPEETIDMLYICNQHENEHMKYLQAECLKHNREIAQKNEDRLHYMHQVTDQLKAHFIKTNEFMRDIKEKRNAAVARIKVVLASQQEIRASIDKYREHIADLLEFHKNLHEIVRELEPYEKVIQDAVQKSDTMLTTKECMNRCDALVLAQKDIARLQDEKIHGMEKMRTEMSQLTHGAACHVLGIKNKLSEIERLYKEASHDCQLWECILIKTQNLIIDYTLTKQRCIDGITFTYRLLSKRLNTAPDIHISDIGRMLDFIKDEVEVLHKVWQEMKENGNYY